LFLLNHRQDRVILTLDRSGTDLINGRHIEAGETLVLDAADVAVVRSPLAPPEHAEPSPGGD
jgi:beta-galactosidase